MPLLRTSLVAFAFLLFLAPVTLRGSSTGRRSAGDQLRGLFSRARDIGRLLAGGNAAKAWWALAYRAYSNSTSLGMRRDLTVPFTGPQAKIPISVRPLSPTDDLSALESYVKERKEIQVSISSSDLVLHYDRVRKHRGGIGVAPARNEVCEICSVRIRPQVFQEIRKNDQIIECASCQRILYDPDNLDNPFEVA